MSSNDQLTDEQTLEYGCWLAETRAAEAGATENETLLIGEAWRLKHALAQIAALPCARNRTGGNCRTMGLTRTLWCPSCIASEAGER